MSTKSEQNGKQLATPFFESATAEGAVNLGMTKRETIAMHLMAGILAKYTLNRPEDQKITAQAAVECADALLEALE